MYNSTHSILTEIFGDDYKRFDFKQLEETKSKSSDYISKTIAVVSEVTKYDSNAVTIKIALDKIKNFLGSDNFSYTLKLAKNSCSVQGIKINAILNNKPVYLYIHTFEEEYLAKEFIHAYSYSIFNNIYTKMIKYVLKGRMFKIINGSLHLYKNISNDTINTYENTSGTLTRIYSFDTVLEILGIDKYKFNNVRTFDDLYNLITTANNKYLCKEMFRFKKRNDNLKLLNKFLDRIEKDDSIPDKIEVSPLYLEKNDYISVLDFKSSEGYNKEIKNQIFDLYYKQSNRVDLMPIKDSFVAYCNHLLGQIRKCNEINPDYVLKCKTYAIQDVETAKYLFLLAPYNLIVGLSFSLNMDFRGATIELVFPNNEIDSLKEEYKKLIYSAIEDLGLQYNFYIDEKEMQARLKQRKE